MTASQQEALFGSPDGSEKEVRSSLDRLEMVYEALGFIPHTKAELNDAMLALDNLEVTGGYARMLNEVLQHQHKAETKDATAALRSIVGRVKGYASTSKGDIGSLIAIREELQPYLGNQNFLELDDVSNLSGWSDQPLTKRGLGLISRHLAVSDAIARHEMPLLDDAAKDPAIAELMASARIYEAADAADAGVEEANRRREFWIGRLQEATQHTVVRPMAFQALRSLGVEQER